MSADTDVTRLRIPPHSKEAEQSILGGLMLDNEAWDRAADLLTEADFYRFEHRLIYAAIGALVNACKPADVLTTFEQLQRIGKDQEAGGLPYLNALAQSVPSAANMRRYAEIVRERAILRRMVAVGDEIATLAWQADGGEINDRVDRAAQLVSDLHRTSLRSEPQDLGTLLTQRLDHYTALSDGEVQAGWATRFEKLDAILNGGFRPGHVVVLAARPKVGKTSFAMDLALHQALENGLPVLALTQEMPAAELADRIVSRAGSIDASHLQTGKLTDKEWGRLSEATHRLSTQASFLIDDQPALTLADIRAKARKAFSGDRARRGGVLVLDYLQLTSGGPQKGKGERNRNTEIEEVSRGLKALAKQLGITVLALSQLNRKVEERAGKRPNLGDLRDSGAIEQDADQIVFLWPVRLMKEGALMLVGLDVAANRHGPTGEFGLDFWRAYHRWEQSEMSIEPPTRTEQRGKGDFE